MSKKSENNQPESQEKQSTNKTTSTKKISKARVNRLIRSRNFIIVLIVIVALLPTIFFYNKSKVAEQRLNDPNTANQKVIDEVVKKVGRHILLPTGEQPTLATVSDVTKVKGQPFFINAANGDKVLIYTQARKAILYRPSKDIIVEVAPLNIDSSQLKTTTQ